MTTKLIAKEEPAIYKSLLETAGNTRKAISDLVVSDVAQIGPSGSGEFDYIDISSVNNLTKQVEAPKRLPCSEAPSRARQRVRAGDVLVSMTRPNLNAVALVPHALDGATASTGFHVLRADTGTEPAWLFHAMQSPQFVAAMSELVQGALYPAVRPKDIRAFSLFVPPKAAQREVVAYLDEQLSRLDFSVAALHRAQANLKRYRASVLKAACEGRLVPTEAELARQEGRDFETGAQLLQRILVERREKLAARGKNKEPVLAATAALSPLPHGWAWSSVEQLNLAARPCAYGVLQPGKDQSDGVRLVRVGDVNDGRVDAEGIKRIDPEIAAAYPRTKLSGGEVLITLVGAIGRTAVVPSSLAGANTARAVGVIPLSSLVSAHWVELWFRNPSTVDRMTAASHEVARKTLNLEDVRLAAVALPPLAEQHRIVAEADRRLSLIRVAEAQVAANLARAQRLRQSILQAAFAG
jgi:type I restriction enzyme, S subunit